MEDTSRVWRFKEAAEYLGITPNTIRVWCSQKKVPFIKINGSIRFRRSDLDEFLGSNLIGPDKGRGASDAS
jgi:excisionase family DNA binding protein